MSRISRLTDLYLDAGPAMFFIGVPILMVSGKNNVAITIGLSLIFWWVPMIPVCIIQGILHNRAARQVAVQRVNR